MWAVCRAHLRYTAARCLLHLARRYDSRLGSAAYTALALAMQDPYMEVRRDVGDKVSGGGAGMCGGCGEEAG